MPYGYFFSLEYCSFFVCVIAFRVAGFGNILPSGGVVLKIALVVDGCLDNDSDLICSHVDTLTDCQNELGSYYL